MRRGEIRWYTFRLPDKRRPVLILTRDEVIDRLNEIIVVPATRTIRGLTTEVVLTASDGMPTACALNFDHVSLAPRSRIGPALCYLSETRWAEVRDAQLIACGFGSSGRGYENRYGPGIIDRHSSFTWIPRKIEIGGEVRQFGDNAFKLPNRLTSSTTSPVSS